MARLTEGEEKMTLFETYRAALAADDAYGAELRRVFGLRAGDVRYTKQGNGEQGSTLRALYAAKIAADAAHFHAER